MGMSIDGFEHLNKKWAKILAEHGEIKDTFLMQQGELLLADTKKNTPVDTGLLRANWKSTPVSDSSIKVYNNTDYAAHVEFGHRTRGGGVVKGRKMLHRAIVHRKSVFLAESRVIIRRLLDA